MGGAAGHIPHLYEDLGLEIGEIKQIVRSLASGGGEIQPIEKVDGQNIFFRWDPKTDQIYTARNKSDILKGGMTSSEFTAKWKGHPGESAFMNGFAAIDTAVKSLSRDELVDIFGEDGNRFANAEIMYTSKPNMIIYDGNYIVLHNLQVYNPQTGKTESAPSEDFQRLVSAVSGAEAAVSGEIWRVHGPQIAALQSEPEAADKFSAAVDSIVGPYNVSDSDTLGDFFMSWLRESLEKRFDDSVPVHTQEELLKRLRDLASGVPAKDVKVPAGMESMRDVITKKYAEEQLKIAIAPLERAVSNFAADILKHVRSAFIGSDDLHNASIESMRERLESTISAIESYSGSDAAQIREKLEKELEKLGGSGASLSNVEGIVFEYPPGSGNLKKLTGNFAALNQIVGALGRKIAPKNESRGRFPRLASLLF